MADDNNPFKKMLEDLGKILGGQDMGGLGGLGDIFNGAAGGGDIYPNTQPEAPKPIVRRPRGKNKSYKF